ncbi:MAG: immunity 26/phosphotriesterase HocA family protein, partial [Planctomycetales bacterium]
MEAQFAEGTWFGVPLHQEGYAVGVVARHSPSKEIVLAYFFGPRRDSLPETSQLQHLTPDDSLKVLMVGFLGLKEGSWPIIGKTTTWSRDCWPIPQY